MERDTYWNFPSALESHARSRPPEHTMNLLTAIGYGVHNMDYSKLL